MQGSEARRRFAASTVARLATVDHSGQPHLVPITFALLDDELIVTAVDHKPKRTTALRRLANIAANPAVCVLVDEYTTDWNALWWVRADGRARVLAPGDEAELRERAIVALTSRYGQYAQHRPAGDLIVITVDRWTGWTG